MKKYTLLIALLLQMVFATAQSIVVSFTAHDQNGNYCQLSEVNVTNLTQNWSQTLVYPDTILVLDADGIAEVPVTEGFAYNRPNPFHGTTEAVLNLANGGQTHIQLVNIQGMVLAECDANLVQGESVIKVSLAEPQLALLCASNENGTHVLKMLNIGRAGVNSVEIGSVRNPKSGLTRAVGEGNFSLGDEMSYAGVIVQEDGTMLMSNNTITQAQYDDAVIVFEFDIEQQEQLPEGALSGLFTISSVGKLTYFSRGNLQYQASTHTWRFAENQWDFVGTQTPFSGEPGGTVAGSDNANVSSTYDGWIDLYAWGTGGNPTYLSSSAFFSSFNEWGNKPISNGGNQENLWKTLSKEEWEYLLNERSTASGMRYVRARVNDIYGIILLPDDWQTTFYSLDAGTVNDVSLSDWTTELEPHGVVFLPAAGYRFGSSASSLSVSGVGSYGDYWSSTPKEYEGYGGYQAYRVSFNINGGLINPVLHENDRSIGYSVRLVYNLSQLPTVTTSEEAEANCTTVTCGGNVVADGGLPILRRGICFGTSSSPTVPWDSYTVTEGDLGSFVDSITITNPDLEQPYYVRAYASNVMGTAYGEARQVYVQGPCLPRVGTLLSVSNITTSSAVCGGIVISDGGAEVTERGICYSNTNQNPTIADSHVAANGGGLGSFSCTLYGLQPNTGYRFCAYATNSEGTVYGYVHVFSTLGYSNVPTVVTYPAEGVTSSSALCGGNVTSEGEATVTEYGVCYSKTNTQPTYSDSHVVSGSGTGAFSATLSGLDANTTYYFCAYAKNSYGIGYGQVRSFTTTGGTTPPDPSDPNLLSGQFSVSATRKVYFSKGNLQYQASTGTWRFAPNQYDAIGSSNDNISSTYSGYIDLFGWGTSGYNGCMPYQTSLSLVYGGNLSSIANSNYDWGVYNMTNMRTLTADEWNYVLSERNNALALKAPATVNGVHGWILLPDSWSSSPYTFVSYDDGARSYSSNVYTSTQWSSMQTAGAVFLPAGGWRYSSGNVSMTTYVGTWGYYWSTTSENAVTFAGNYCYSGQDTDTYTGCAVRLVRTVQ